VALDAEGDRVIAVIGTAYNNRFGLRRAIESLFAQTRKDWRLFLTDDGSEDGTEIDFEKGGRFHDLFQIDYTRFQKNVSKKRSKPRSNPWIDLPINFALQRVREARVGSDYVAYIDDNDIFLPEHLESLVEKVERSDLDFSWSYSEIHEGGVSTLHGYEEINCPGSIKGTELLHRTVARKGMKAPYWPPVECGEAYIDYAFAKSLIVTGWAGETTGKVTLVGNAPVEIYPCPT
jgi:glycosyltransferase involved in cell wall biosynthesis